MNGSKKKKHESCRPSMNDVQAKVKVQQEEQPVKEEAEEDSEPKIGID